MDTPDKKRLFVLTSDGSNELPAAHRRTSICFDLNVTSRLWSSTHPDFEHLRAWLAQARLHPGHAIMTSMALEEAISTKKTRICRVPQILKYLSKPILGDDAFRSFRVDGEGTASDAIEQLAEDTLVGCAEVAWVHNANLKSARRKDLAAKNIAAFLAWRRSLFPSVAQHTSTLLCVASLGGNDIANKALKAHRPLSKADEIRNRAFDATHLDHFGQACRPDRRWSKGKALSVMVTADKDLGRAITSFTPGWVGAQGVALLTMELPWLSATRYEEVRQEFVSWRHGFQRNSVPKDAAALMAVRDTYGFVPKKVQKLYRELSEFRLRGRSKIPDY